MYIYYFSLYMTDARALDCGRIVVVCSWIVVVCGRIVVGQWSDIGWVGRSGVGWVGKGT